MDGRLLGVAPLALLSGNAPSGELRVAQLSGSCRLLRQGSHRACAPPGVRNARARHAIGSVPEDGSAHRGPDVECALRRTRPLVPSAQLLQVDQQHPRRPTARTDSRLLFSRNAPGRFGRRPARPDMNCQPLPRLLSVSLKLVLLVALVAFLARTASAQGTAGDTTIRLSLGEAVRLAARQNVGVESARSRVEAAQARVTQKRADLLPNVSALASERRTTLNSAAAFPIELPVPDIDPKGSILGRSEERR